MRARGAGLAAVACLLLGACSVGGLNFVQDRRLEIVAPDDEAEVTLPVILRWTMRDFDADGSFGVLVDRAPPPPGRDLAWLVREDVVCARTPGCPDADYLASGGIHATTQTRLVLESLPRLGSDDEPDLHEATIILLDRAGRRIGETAVIVTFEVVR